MKKPPCMLTHRMESGMSSHTKRVWSLRSRSRIHSPVRICQPTSPSARRLSQPLGTHRKSQTTRTMKKQSEKEGTKNRAHPRENIALVGGAPATTTPAATDCWDVATLDHRQR